MVEKTFYFVKETFPKTGNSLYYGKEDKLLRSENIKDCWFIKEYGFETLADAKRCVRRLQYHNNRMGYDPNERKIDIASTVLIFEDADAAKFKFIKKERLIC